jgi:uncharacterized membrane protein YphA (DoxX/SURF4 family)
MAPGASATSVLPAPPDDSIFRSPEQPGVVVSDEQQKLAAERAARRDARVAALSTPTTAAPAPVPQEPVVRTKRNTDKFFGSLGLFLLRIVVAAILAVRGVGLLINLTAANTFFGTTILPQPEVFAVVVGVASLLAALALILGILTRVVGIGVTAIAVGALVLVQWGASFSPFSPDRYGFFGELELLLAAVGVLFICVGGGGWSIDRSFRASRERDKLARAAIDN